jgi:hypothetical protein
MNSPILRSIWAVVAGYLVLVVGIGLVDFLVSLISPEHYADGPDPAAKWLIVELVIGTVLVMAGGYVTVSIARRSYRRHALALGILTSGLALFSLAFYHGRQPAWFQLVMAVVAIPAALIGATPKTRN